MSCSLGILGFPNCGYEKRAWINGVEGEYVDLLTGQERIIIGISIPVYGFYYLKQKE